MRAARRASFDLSLGFQKQVEELGNCLESALMTEFMPLSEKAAVRDILKKEGLSGKSRALQVEAASKMTIVEADMSSASPFVQNW